MPNKKSYNIYPRNHIIEIEKLLVTKRYDISLKEFGQKSEKHDLIPNIRSYQITDEIFKKFVAKPCQKGSENINHSIHINLRLVSIDTLCFKLLPVKPEDPLYDDFKIRVLTCIFMHICELEELLPENSGESRFMFGIRCKFYNIIVKYFLIEGVDEKRVQGLFDDMLYIARNKHSEVNDGFNNVMDFSKKSRRFVTWICTHHKKITDLLYGMKSGKI